MKNALTFICGSIFAFGLGLAGMTKPSKVSGFLDFTGHWDPSLILVMVGAIAVYFLGHRLVLKKPRPVFEEIFQIPKMRKVDRPLLIGSALFGIGWGLGGFCPGPAMTSIASLDFQPLVFVASLFVGMFIFEWMQGRNKKS